MRSEPFLQDRVELELPPASTTAALVAEYLRRVVHRGELGPGDRLPAERELAVVLGVGRDTLREALQVLEDEGYLVRRRGGNGGAFLTDLARPLAAFRARMLEDREGLEELFDVREGVEVQIARLAAARRTATDMAAVRDAHEALHQARTHGDFRRSDMHFHGQLAAAARSRRLTALMLGVRGELFDHLIAMSGGLAPELLDPGFVEGLVSRAVEDYVPVVEAVDAQDSAAAGEAMRAYLMKTRQGLLNDLGVR